jgi:hypothetical protein
MFKYVPTIFYLKLRLKKTLISILFFYIVVKNFLTKKIRLEVFTGEEICVSITFECISVSVAGLFFV